MTQKERDAPIAHSKRRRRKGASVPFAGCITLSVYIAIPNGGRGNLSYGSPVTYYLRASYTFRVSDALGYARNNSECLFFFQ